MLTTQQQLKAQFAAAFSLRNMLSNQQKSDSYNQRQFHMVGFFKKVALLLFIVSLSCACHKKTPHAIYYDETANAKLDITKAQEEAKLAQIPLIIIFGANWCDDCQALSHSLEKGELAAKIAKEFKIVKVNVGNFDTNLDIANAYGNPIQGGIPGAAILSADNKVIYVTKPGELSVVRRRGDDGIYDFLKEKSK